MKVTTRKSYSKRIQHVIAYLTDHLDDALDLHRLAEEAHFSAYHFHRVYCAMIGESVADTLRRLRLHRAAVKLLASDTPVARLAHEAQYSSVQAFSRAFKEAHRVAPAAYRARGRHVAERQRSASTQEEKMADVNIQTIARQRVVALRHLGDYQDIGNSFERLTAWAAGRKLIGAQARSFGIYYDDPSAIPTRALRSDACLSVSDDIEADGEYRITHTPGGRCAVLIHVGPYAELETRYRWLYGVWLPQSGFDPADQPCFEEYLNDAHLLPPSQWRTAICLPLQAA
ncbi:MAG: GyrI-like domain-containing protein [Burkholderiales bacterium]